MQGAHAGVLAVRGGGVVPLQGEDPGTGRQAAEATFPVESDRIGNQAITRQA
jgi:hypothetical protein